MYAGTSLISLLLICVGGGKGEGGLLLYVCRYISRLSLMCAWGGGGGEGGGGYCCMYAGTPVISLSPSHVCGGGGEGGREGGTAVCIPVHLSSLSLSLPLMCVVVWGREGGREGGTAVCILVHLSSLSLPLMYVCPIPTVNLHVLLLFFPFPMLTTVLTANCLTLVAINMLQAS